MSRLSILNAALPVLLVGALSACPVDVPVAPKPKPVKKDPNRNRPPTRAKNKPLAAKKKKVRLMFAGDTSLARGMTRVSESEGDGNPAWMFQKMMPLVADADLFFLNVEMVLADKKDGEALQKKWRIRAKERYAAGLKAVGVNVASVSNNHMHDFGAQGIRSTVDALGEQGIRVTGVEWKPGAGQELIKTRIGPLNVGFLAFNIHGDEYGHPKWWPRIVPFKRKTMLAEVKAAAAEVDVLVVSMHWGGELAAEPYQSMESDARNLVKAGADIIIGSGPHVAMPTVEIDGALVAYCLGDFVFDKSTPWIRHRTDPRFLLAVEYEGKERVKWELLPMRMDQTWRPYPVSTDDLNPADWIGMHEPSVDLRRLLPLAKVERINRGKRVACDSWENKRIRYKGHYLRWLRPRWICEIDPEPEHTVATSVETSGWVPRRGVWAHPHKGGVTRIVFKDVPLQEKLEGWAGIPDWPLEVQAAAEDILLTVKVGGQKTQLVVPHERGWKELSLDTSAFAGTREDVVVEIEGGKDRKEPGFLFDVFVP